LQEKKITLEDFKRDIRRSITVDKVMNKEVSSKINVTDQTSTSTSERTSPNSISSNRNTTWRRSSSRPHRTLKCTTRTTRRKTKPTPARRFSMLANRLDSGDDFATLAMTFSEDPDTSGNGGDLGTVPESSLRNIDPGTREAVMKLKPGQYSTIVTLVDP